MKVQTFDVKSAMTFIYHLVAILFDLKYPFVVSQSTPCQLHQDFRGDSAAIPSSNQSQRPPQLLHEEGDLGLDRLPYESNGKITDTPSE